MDIPSLIISFRVYLLIIAKTMVDISQPFVTYLIVYRIEFLCRYSKINMNPTRLTPRPTYPGTSLGLHLNQRNKSTKT